MDLIAEIRASLHSQVSPQCNLGTYSTTEMDADVTNLFSSLLPYNKVNYNEYPAIKKMEAECINFLKNMLHCDDLPESFGLSTHGSSEGIFMACNTLKQEYRGHGVPNIIISDCAHSSWINAARILNIELREVSFRTDSLNSSLEQVIDENTIALGVTLGTTSTGLFEPVEEINHYLEDYQKKNNHFIPIHVDAASGGFIAPFQFPDLKWDFRLTHVSSINISGHKYGMVFPSIGWVFWKEERSIGEKMKIEYLKDTFFHFGINFSSPAAYVVAQYYSLKKLGFSGYAEKTNYLYHTKAQIESELSKIPYLTIISECNIKRLPVVCWVYNEEYLFDIIVKRFEEYGWTVPCCQISRGSSARCCRIVVRHNVTREIINKLIHDIASIHLL
ncbi:TPA: aminotransferase class V-fold PLP-dependent enzyme [Escherichia coli]|uniref:aminotransferase class V-fold PLP-dependent enzyme n=1 Tax=Escherichia coli TaxID=562 RepID=UPI000BE3F050|nr:aminotransferase class V-fold PLP-dependent enzyme [Escherichia coli]EES4172099.1 aminotransferase class V-fold PLP-dependent enzyme [Escherichia coli]EJG7545363.1 aminotransferase class V-fold PLP-dependent enzyme [Escherichia coli]MBB7083844.1 aminotransferase class V-fold PLP-dependent enzyme [Escherichia coli]HAX2346419.1 aminotransferase class V-fold PLP-dependent enzyme [Escherichia coli]HBQ4494838.1 aminotransferase class V-fold PLP-dependent enzyme [Escherichia coli]